MTITSKFSTNSGYETSGCVECKVLAKPTGSSGFQAPAVEVSLGGAILSYNALSPDLIVLPIHEARRLRTDGMIDW